MTINIIIALISALFGAFIGYILGKKWDFDQRKLIIHAMAKNAYIEAISNKTLIDTLLDKDSKSQKLVAHLFSNNYLAQLSANPDIYRWADSQDLFKTIPTIIQSRKNILFILQENAELSNTRVAFLGNELLQQADVLSNFAKRLIGKKDFKSFQELIESSKLHSGKSLFERSGYITE